MIRLASLLVLLGLFTLAPAVAEVTPSTSYGLSAGTTTGIGLSYRYWPDSLGVQVTGVPMVNFLDRSQMLSLGVAGLWTLQDLRWTKFYSYVGGAGLYENRTWLKSQLDLSAGAGIGFEFIAFDHIGLDLMGGYGLSLPAGGSLESTFSVALALYYRVLS